MNRSSLLAVVLLVSACASAPQPAMHAPDRSQRPDPGEAPDLVLPPIQQFTLENGMRVVLMEKRDLPLVQLNVVTNAGSVFDPTALPGLASMTAAMLDEGAGGMSSLEIAEAFEMLGARFGVGAGTHTASMTLRVPSQRLPDALRIASTVMLRPDFPAHELDRLRAERLTALVRRHDNPGSVVAALFDATIFGAQHPYGRDGLGTEAALRAMTVGDVRAFYQRQWAPNNSTAIVVGDIDAAMARRLLLDAFGGWPRGTPIDVALPPAPQVRGRAIYLVDMPGSAQSTIRLGRIGVARNTRDYYALEVMNTILGGSFTSRLNQNLREDKGYAYGAGSSFEYMPAPGPWMASSNVQTQSTGPALAEFMNELRGMHVPIPEDELDRARNFLAMRHPAGFQSVAGIAARLGEMVQYNLPPDYFNRYVDNVLAVTRADVERVAREYIDPDNVAIFVVGDRRAIEEQVRQQNLGEIRFMSVTDVLGPVPSRD
jgi:zinc protease